MDSDWNFLQSSKVRRHASPMSANDESIAANQEWLLHAVLLDRSSKVNNLRIIECDRVVDIVILRSRNDRVQRANLYKIKFWLGYVPETTTEVGRDCASRLCNGCAHFTARRLLPLNYCRKPPGKSVNPLLDLIPGRFVA